MMINHVLWGTVACFQNNSKSDKQHFAKLQETADFLPYFLSDKQQCSKRQQIFFRAALATTSSCLGSFWVHPWTPATVCHSHRSSVQPQTDGSQMDLANCDRCDPPLRQINPNTCCESGSISKLPVPF